MGALKQSNDLRPSFESYGNLGAAYFYMRRYQDSAENLELALKIDDKDWLNWGNLGDTLYRDSVSPRRDARSAYRKAIELGGPRLEVNPKDSLAPGLYGGLLRHGRPRAAGAGTDDAGASKSHRLTPMSLFRAAILYNHFGDTEKTTGISGKSVAAGYSRTVIHDTPDFDHLKDDPRFRALAPGTEKRP